MHNEIADYAKAQRVSRKPVEKQAVQSCVDAYKNNGGPVDSSQDDLLVEQIRHALGDTVVRLTLHNGKILDFDLS
jgi:hypothetical protein